MTPNGKPCEAFIARLNDAIDELCSTRRNGQGVHDAFAPVRFHFVNDAHVEVCRDCRQVLDRATLLIDYASPIPPLPPSFAQSVTALALADRAEQRGKRILIPAGLVALAASVVVAIFAFPTQEAPSPVMIATAPKGIQQPLADAREAIVSLTEKVADDTLIPAQNLFAIPAPTPRETESVLTEIPEAARAGLDPLVSTPKRALNLFIRDVGGFAGARKSDS